MGVGVARRRHEPGLLCCPVWYHVGIVWSVLHQTWEGLSPGLKIALSPLIHQNVINNAYLLIPLVLARWKEERKDSLRLF